MKFIKRNRELILASIGFILIIVFYLIRGMDNNVLLGLIGTVATLYFGTIKHRIENDKLFKELFQEFNFKYDEKFNNLINEIKYDNLRVLDTEERNIIIDYLNLSAEEYLWRSRNRIPKDVWNSWRAGILENLEIKQIKEVYYKETSTKNGKLSFYGLVDELKKYGK